MTQIQRVPVTHLSGSHAAEHAQAALDESAARYHLISPATRCGSLPEGCEVAISIVRIDPDPRHHEVYLIAADQMGLSKTALERIAAAAGLSWDPGSSGRIDDGADPHYCRWRAVGRYRHFDGALMTVTGEKEMDLREDSAQIAALWQRHDAAQKAGRSSRAPDAQIREMRLHIQAHAESKAKLRAIRSLGVRTSYSAQELARPFAVARLMATGRTDDPELRRRFAEMHYAALLGATSTLYGGSPPHASPRASEPHRAPLLPAAAPLALPPPELPAPAAAPAESPVAAPAESPVAAPAELPAPAAAPAAAAVPVADADTVPMIIPGGPRKGTPIMIAESCDLLYWIDRIDTALRNGMTQPIYRERNAQLLAGMRAEFARRRTDAPLREPGDDSDEEDCHA